jgi:branched-chain amino acid transport system ATP-binding protein
VRERPMAAIIAASGLNKRFGAVVAASDISIDIEEGTVTGLIGTNGAGKTTFVNMITGYLKPDSGTIAFRGEDITQLPPRAITRKGVARSFQIPQLFNSMSVRDNLAIAVAARVAEGMAGLRPVDRGAIDAGAGAMLERFGLAAFSAASAGTLPEGIRKLLDMAVAMVAEPIVLLLDEPTSGVASEEKFAVMDRVMAATMAAGVTTLFVEHDMDIVRRYATRVIAFYAGTVLSDGPPAAVLDDARVRELIIGEKRQAIAAAPGGVADA